MQAKPWAKLPVTDGHLVADVGVDVADDCAHVEPPRSVT